MFFPCVVCVCQCLHILVQPVWRSATKFGRLAKVVLLNLSSWSLVCRWLAVVHKCIISKRAATAAQSFKTSCSPIWVGRYFRIQYEMTQLSTNTVKALLDATVVTGLALVTLWIRLSRKLRADCPISSLIIDPGCPLPQFRTVQQLKTDLTFPDDGIFHALMRHTDWQPLWCIHHLPYDASNAFVALYCKVVSWPGAQQKQDSVLTTVWAPQWRGVDLL